MKKIIALFIFGANILANADDSAFMLQGQSSSSENRYTLTEPSQTPTFRDEIETQSASKVLLLMSGRKNQLTNHLGELTGETISPDFSEEGNMTGNIVLQSGNSIKLILNPTSKESYSRYTFIDKNQNTVSINIESAWENSAKDLVLTASQKRGLRTTIWDVDKANRICRCHGKCNLPNE